MIWFLLAFAVLAVLAPFAGADTRDSRDWRSVEPLPEPGRVRSGDSRVPASVAPGRVAAHRPASTAC